MAPRLTEWGSAGWQFLHSVSFAYPEAPSPDDRQKMLTFLTSVGYVLPCKLCRAHYEAYVRTRLNSTTLDSRETLSRFVVDMHNDVNRRLRKHEVGYEQVKVEYEDGYHGQWMTVSIVVVIVLCAFVILKCIRGIAPLGRPGTSCARR